ncbi:MAG: M24 family metallopeptidase, partial [Chthoniobacterales bacterium]
MKWLRIFGFAIFVGSAFLPREMAAAPTPAERISDIQKALRDAKLDGWLFYDFRGSDPLALRILKLDEHAVGSRRWFYFIPATGEPTKIVHRIEAAKLDALPGERVEYSSWKEQHELLRNTLLAGNTKPRVAMQYSPMNDIPYMSRVDAGTIELIRSLGADIVTSAELVQQFEAVWSPEQLQTHVEASDKMHRIFFDAFGEIARRINANEATTEYDIEQFILRRWQEENMGGEHADAIVSVNANTANPHYVPTREKALPIKRGDFVLMDLASKFREPDAVFTDQTWTGFVGETVPEEYTKVFNVVRDARDAAVEFVRTNVRASKQIRGADVDDVSRGVITRAGYGQYFTHRTGHSIGEEV